MFLLKRAEFEGGRGSFGEFLNTRGLTHYGAEIGTHRGDFANQLLATWQGSLSCIDPWTDLPEYHYQKRFLDDSEQGNRKKDMAAARELLAPYGDRANLIQGTSEETYRFFSDSSFDFVYLDGNHEMPHVLDDIERWWSKLGTGGILAGHDIITPWASRGDLWEHDIQTAVFQFAASRQIIVYLVPEEGGRPWSYYMIKPAGIS